MRASLISREVIADSIELMVHAHDFDGLVCLVGCDKTAPAALMALARVDKPAVVLYGGPMRSGHWRDREVTIQDVWEAVGAGGRGLMPRDDLDELERLPARAWHVRRALHREHDGGGPRLPRARADRRRPVPPTSRSPKDEAAARATLAVGLVEQGVTARTFLDRRALLNAMAGVAGSGGSTNGILHLLAIAREAGTPLTLADLAGVASAPRCSRASRRPAATWPRTSTASAAPRRDPRARARRPRRRLGADGRRADACGGDRVTRRRRTARSSCPSSSRSSRAGRSTRCAATSRPEGSLVKLAGTERRAHTGPARVFDTEEACTDASGRRARPGRRRARRPLRGPRGGRACARC